MGGEGATSSAAGVVDPSGLTVRRWRVLRLSLVAEANGTHVPVVAGREHLLT